MMYYYYERDRAQLAANTIATARAMTNSLDLQLGGVQASLATLATSRMLLFGGGTTWDRGAHRPHGVQPVNAACAPAGCPPHHRRSFSG
ncbi:MAG: hypothetical protein ABIR26_12060, partial [Ramlibacter sp.]